MSRDEFVTRFRGRMLLHLTECWAARKCPPSELGLLLDEQAARLKELLHEMYAALVGPELPKVPNGQPQRKGTP